MKIFNNILFLCLGITTAIHGDSSVRLIGIYNNLTGATVRIEGGQYVVGKPFECELPLPVRVLVTTESGDPYTIVINETQTNVNCRGYGVNATVEAKAGSGNTICVPNSTTRFIPGKKVNAFQNVLLVLDNKATTGAKDELPFDFAISAWTTTRPPWNQNKIAAPIDDNSAAFSKPLRVLQGYAAWGSGVTPRLYHGAIAHVYNDSPFTLYITRTMARDSGPYKELAAYNFEQLVPPYTAVPWAASWIPKIADPNNLSNTGIKIYALQPPVQNTDLPPAAFDYVFSAGSTELDIPPRDVSEIVSSMEQQVPNFVSTVTGQPDLKALTKSKVRYTSHHYFKIFTNSKTDMINVLKCQMKQPIGCEVMSSDLKATLDGSQPNLFKLIVTGDLRGAFNIHLSKIPDEKVRD